MALFVLFAVNFLSQCHNTVELAGC